MNSSFDPQRTAAARERFSAEAVPPDAIGTWSADVLAPCALGAVLSAPVIAQLKCKVVADAANNQLATAQEADRLQQQGIHCIRNYTVTLSRKPARRERPQRLSPTNARARRSDSR